jgi:DNA-binding CsgD family transcriptional regulator
VIPWRSGVALALQRLDREPARAAKLADEEIALARACGAGRALGMALRARALAGPAKLRLGRLDEAEAVLERAGAPLERARTLCDLGAAHRAAGARTAAREALRDAHELAVGCAATALIERAREELAAAGARPRTVSGPGASDLTPSERRVAGMAAEGATNREIAQALFLSEKTVENHLTRAYAKLGVRRRRDLPAALAAAA